MPSATTTPAPAHGRRRKRVPKTPTVSTDKENQANNNITDRRRTATTAAKPPAVSLTDDVSFLDDSNNNTSSESSSATISRVLQQVLRASKDHVASVSLWKDHRGLAECVVKASLSFSSNNNASLSFLLEENTSKLQNTARKLIKEASEAKDAQQKYRWLMVAAHLLRATGLLFDQVEKQESCFRLLYHLITLASDMMSKGGDWKASLIVVAGYEVLGKMLLRYSTMIKNGGDEIVGFDRSTNEISKRGLQFVVPIPQSKRAQIGTMGFNQISTIAFKATLSVANCFIQLWFRPIQEETRTSDSDCLFGEEIQKVILEPALKRDKFPIHGTTELLGTVYLPWLRFVADFANKENARELSSNCKAAYRLLWDAASKLKGVGTAQDQSELNNKSLELRRCAILMILPVTSNERIRDFLQKEHFEFACSNASKASNVFVQQSRLMRFPVSPGSPLHEFHKCVGKSLEDLRPAKKLPLMYVEYCSYRALHTMWAPRIPQSGEEDYFNNEAPCSLLWIMILGISFRQRLEADPEQYQPLLELIPPCSDIDGIEFVQRRVEVFNETVLGEFEKLSSDFKNKATRLFSIVSLQRCIFDALREQTWRGKQNDLLGAALILERCIGPFTSEIIHSMEDESKIVPLFDLAIECSVRPLSALEALRNDCLQCGENQSADNLLRHSEEFAERLCKFLSSARERRPPRICIEKAAKSLSILGRQRFESSMYSQSLLPQLYSLKLYSLLFLENPDGGYHLPSRLAQLASTFQNLGKTPETCFTLCLVLASEVRQCYQSTTGDSYENLLLFLAAKSKGILFPVEDYIFPSKLAKSTINKLVNLICNWRQSYSEFASTRLQSESKASERVQTIDTLIKGQVQGDPDAIFNSYCSIGQILVSAFSDFIGDSYASDLSGVAHKQLMLLVDLQAALCNSIHQGGLNEESDPHRIDVLLKEYEMLAYETQRAVDFVVDTKQFGTPTVKGLLNLVASARLLPVRYIYQSKALSTNLIESPLGILARHLSSECHRIFFSTDTAGNVLSDDVDTSSSVGLSGMQYHFFLDFAIERQNLQKDEVGRLLDYGAKCFWAWRDYSGRLDETTLFDMKVFVWSLTQLQNHFQREGDFNRVVTLAEWISLILLKGAGGSDGGSSLFRSVALSAQMSSGIRANVESCDTSFPDCNLGAWSPKEFALAELFVSNRRGCVFDGQVSNISTYPGNDLELLKVAIHENDGDKVKVESGWLSQWVLSSIELAQSELAASCGYFYLALQHAQRCIRLCHEPLMVTAKIVTGDGSPFWVNLAASGHLERVSRRVIETLSHRSNICQQIGDHRKASSYLLTAGEILGLKSGDERARDLDGVLSIFKSATSLVRRNFFRVMSSMYSTTSALDLVEHTISRVDPLSLASGLDLDSESNDQSFARKLGMLRDFMSVGDALYADLVPPESQNLFLQYYQKAILLHQEMNAGSDAESKELLWATPQVQLRNARLLICANGRPDDDCVSRIALLCSHVTADTLALSEDKAWAHYYLGMLSLSEARRSGCLRALWEANNTESDVSELIQKARTHFVEAATSSSLGTGLLSRNILRSLALVGGLEAGGFSSMSAGILALASIGRSSREFILRSLSDRDVINDSKYRDKLVESFSALDGDLRNVDEKDIQIRRFFDGLSERTPSKWKFVAVALCPSGELLSVSIAKQESTGRFEISTECRFPIDEKHAAYDEIVRPLDAILQRSQKQLGGMDEATVSKKFNKEVEKRSWWERRGQLDKDLCDLLETVDTIYFGSSLQDMDDSDNNFRDDDIESLPCGNLASRFEAAFDLPETDGAMNYVDAESLKKLTVVQLKGRLRDHGVTDKEMRKLRKQQLIDMLIDEETSDLEEAKNPVHNVRCDNECLFLILDENLSRFPFEGMPSLQSRIVSRIPSLPFIYATLLENDHKNHDNTQIEAAQVSYVLDPEGNLQATRSRLEPVIDNICMERNCHWDACVGELPKAGFVESCLRKENGLFLYFGHGGGQVFFPRKNVEELAKWGKQGMRLCRASVLLMGCSSGRLVSVNRKHSKSIEQLPLHYEPEGIAMSYLCAGAPCVVGNLWDVTDRDIDRFAIATVERFFLGGSSGSLPENVSLARSACKLRYIVGCAPVCYGIPVTFSNPASSSRLGQPSYKLEQSILHRACQ